MRRLLLLPMIFLAGCVVSSTTRIYNSTEMTQTSQVNTSVTDNHSHYITQAPPAVAPSVETLVIEEDACPLFELPEPMALPVMPGFDDPAIATSNDMDVAIAGYIVALKKHGEDERTRLEAQYEDYLKQCGR